MTFHKVIYKLVVLLLFSSLRVFSQGESSYKDMKVDDAIELALSHNKKIKIQNSKLAISKYKKVDAKNEKLPDIDIKSSFHILSNINQYQNGWTNAPTTYEVPRIKYNFTLDAQMPIYTGGKILAEENKADIENEIAELYVRKEVRDVKLEIITAYLLGLHLEEQQVLLREKMHEDSAIIKQTEKLKQNGVVTYNDVLRTKLQLSNHQMAYSELENEFRILEHKIKTILALPENSMFSIATKGLLSTVALQYNLEEMINIANKQDESLHISQKEVELMEQEKRIIKSNVLPQIAAGADYGYNYPNFMFFPPEKYLYSFGTIGINIKIPVSNFYKNKTKIKIANQQLYTSKLEVEEKEEQIRHEVYSAQRNIDEVDKKIVIAEEAIKQAKENYRIVRLKYSNQLSLITELIDADNAYLETQSNLVSLQINKQLKYYQLQYILGSL